MLSTSKLFKNPVSSGPAVPPTTIQLLVIAPGGAGTGFAGTFGSAGGAGGVVYYTAYSVAAGTTYSWNLGTASGSNNSSFGIATAGYGATSGVSGFPSSGTGALVVLNGQPLNTGNNYSNNISGALITYSASPGFTPGGGGNGSRPNPGASPPGFGQAGTIIVAYPTTFSAAVVVTGTYALSTTARPGFYVYTLGERFTTSNGGTIRW